MSSDEVLILSDDMRTMWSDVMGSIKDHLPQGTTDMWLSSCEPVSIEGGVLSLAVKNAFAKEQIQKKIIGPLTELLRSKGYADDVRLVISDEPSRDESGGSGDAASDAQTSERAQRIAAIAEKSRLKAGYIFKSFVVGKSNRFAHAACEAVSRDPGRTYNPLFIWGASGLGKTHLMYAIGHQMLADNENAKILYTSAEDFANDMISSIREKTMPDFRARNRNLDLLLIDDIQFFKGKDQTIEEFFHTFDSLDAANKQIVISSDRPPKELDDLDVRIVSRFMKGLATEIQQPDFETRVAILQKKAEMKKVEIPSEVITYIAQNIPDNIRVLEGALTSVIHNTNVLRSSNEGMEQISTENLAVWLKDVLRSTTTGNASIERIQQITAESYGVTIGDLISTKRTGELVEARQIAMYLARDILKCSLQQIGDAFNKKDHTTVIHACKKIEELIGSDPKITTIVDNLRGKL